MVKKSISALSLFMTLSSILLIGCNDKQQNNDGQQTTPDENIAGEKPVLADAKQCYLKVIEGVAEYDNKTIRDSIIFEIEKAGDSVKGIFHWKPYEKDKKISSFKGVLNGMEGNAIATSNAEGMTYKEEVDFELKDSTVTIYYGAMKEDANGVWRYEDKSKTSTQVLKRVACK